MNPGRLGGKHECYLCAIPSPSLRFLWSAFEKECTPATRMHGTHLAPYDLSQCSLHPRTTKKGLHFKEDLFFGSHNLPLWKCSSSAFQDGFLTYLWPTTLMGLQAVVLITRMTAGLTFYQYITGATTTIILEFRPLRTWRLQDVSRIFI